MATVESVCEDCEGKRFQTAVLDYTLAGKNIAEVLAMSVAQAQEYFADGEARTRRRRRSCSDCPTSASAICGSASP